MMSNSNFSILVIGASGRTGLEILRTFSLDRYTQKQVHAFCRDPAKISNQYQKYCHSIVQGDARNPSDIEQAINNTSANIVIMSIGNGDSVARTDIRTTSGKALASVMEKPQYHDVRAVIVSSIGAGTSKMKIGMGMGKVISFHLRHILKDHTGQEAAFESLRDRTVVVRATDLTENKATGKVQHFGDTEKLPTIHIDRADLAQWVVDEVCVRGVAGDTVVNITGMKN